MNNLIYKLQTNVNNLIQFTSVDLFSYDLQQMSSQDNSYTLYIHFNQFKIFIFWESSRLNRVIDLQLWPLRDSNHSNHSY